MGSPGMRLAREQVRRGILAIAEPRHPTVAQGPIGMMGRRLALGHIDLLAIITRGAWVDDTLGLNIHVRAGQGRLLGL